MIIGYARCSTPHQKESLEGQIEFLRREMGAEKIFSETASGRSSHRPAAEEMLLFVRPGDTVAVQRLDRLARSVSELIRLVGVIGERGAHIRSAGESLDTSNASGMLVFHIFCCLAEFEANLIRERTMLGLAVARAKGRTGGRPRKLDRNAVLLAAAAMKAGDVPVREIARRHGVAVSTLYAARDRLSAT